MSTFFIQEKDASSFPVALPHERVLKVTPSQRSEQEQLVGQAKIILESIQEAGIVDMEGAERIGEFIGTLLGQVAIAEEGRKAFKADFLGACQAIDAVAKAYAMPLEEIANKLKLHLLEFLVEQRKQTLIDIRTKGFTETPAKIHGAYIKDQWDFEVTDAKAAQEANPEMWEMVPKKNAVITALKAGAKLVGIQPIKKEILVVEKA